MWYLYTFNTKIIFPKTMLALLDIYKCSVTAVYNETVPDILLGIKSIIVPIKCCQQFFLYSCLYTSVQIFMLLKEEQAISNDSKY